MADLLSVVVVVLGFLAVLLLRSLGTTISGRLRKRRAHRTQARRHFVKAASLLAQARSGKVTAGEGRSLAGTAVNEADLAIELDPNDAGTLIVKSLALEHLRKPAAALKTLDTALSKDCKNSLSKEERADTLAKRAELILGQATGTRNGRMQDALSDLQESLSLKQSNPKVHILLGMCCERIGDKDDALVAWQQALILDPSSPDAKAALERLKGTVEPASVAGTV